MALNDILKDLGLDQYDRDARIGPALFAFLPIGLFAWQWMPALSKLAAGGAAVLLTCGVAYLLKGLTRTRGAAVEDRLRARLGGWPTTLALRHEGALVDDVTRADYHAALRRHGRNIPTVDEQAKDPAAADALFGRAVSWLLEQTRRPDHPTDRLLLKENIDYGFRKNLVGMKGIALSVLAACAGLNVACLYLRLNLSNGVIASGATLLVVYLVLALVWLTVLNDDFVENASWKYAKRLLATLDTF